MGKYAFSVEDTEKLYEVAERWHIGMDELMEQYEKNPDQSLDKSAIDIVRCHRARLKELLEKEEHQPLEYKEYVERVVLESNYS